MSTLSLARIHRQTARALQEELTRLGGEQAQLAEETEELVRFVLKEAREVQAYWESVWASYANGTRDEYQKTGKQLQELFRVILDLLHSAQQTCAGWPHPLPAAKDLDCVTREMEELNARVFSNWPWDDAPWPAVDRRMVEESRAAVARGEVQDLEEMLRELQGQGPGTD